MRKTGQTLWIGLIVLLAAGLLAACKGKAEDRLDEAEISENQTVQEEKAQDPDEKKKTKDIEETEEHAGTEDKETSVICVYVCGQVAVPGVYELRAGDRIVQAVAAAGGMKETAAESYLNLAELLNDGQKVYVPDKEEAKQMEQSAGTADGGTGTATDAGESGDGKVNLNTADRAELMTLGGIGETRADSILEYRREHGRFEQIEDIKKIEGIKDGIYSRIKDKITV